MSSTQGESEPKASEQLLYIVVVLNLVVLGKKRQNKSTTVEIRTFPHSMELKTVALWCEENFLNRTAVRFLLNFHLRDP